MATFTKTDMCLGDEIKANDIIHHAGRNHFYFVTNLCTMKQHNGEWENGVCYIPATRLGPGSYTYDLNDILGYKMFVRPCSMFDSEWTIIS